MKRDDLDELVRKYLACKKLSADDEVKARREYARRERARWYLDKLIALKETQEEIDAE